MAEVGTGQRGRRIGAPVPTQAGLARLVTAVRASNTGLLALSLVVGAGAGGGAVLFRWLIKQFTLLLSGHESDTVASIVEYPSTVTATDPLQHTLDVLATAESRSATARIGRDG